ncbi:MYB-related transcription factor [Rhynchospora pubera]|uniref:MYB-related transcription factor n=1 Tax=Rhynchospora pubera TaxID=906938 RepID=A0AAV8HXW1_9POAL|nr:MYB-related transcription factor [Rhynchospora pubera]
MERDPCNNKNPKRKRGLWLPHEDEKLYNFITRFGVTSWSSLPKQAGLERCGKSCRLRWMNYLNPELKREPISQEEEDLIIALHKKFGNRWARIAESLPGRTDNEIKNYYNCRIKRKNLEHNTTPNTYKPDEKLAEESDYSLTMAVTQPTCYFFNFQSTGVKEEKVEANSGSNMNSMATYDMTNYSDIRISNENNEKNCNYIDFQSATENEILTRLDCKEKIEEVQDVKRLEEYINCLSTLLC